MNKVQAPIGVQLLREWRIRRPHVYRYLQKEFVDLFFGKGVLRLSSFARFAQHHDEERRDTQEGVGLLSHRGESSGLPSVHAVLGQGQDAYVLCGATHYSPELAQAFNADSGFRIDDPTAFGCAIAGAIPGFKGGIEGPCVYSEKVVRRQGGSLDLDSLRVSPNQNELDMGKMFSAISAISGDDLLFLKDSSYEHQREYRLLWMVASPEGYIDVTCPEARDHCTRFVEI